MSRNLKTGRFETLREQFGRFAVPYGRICASGDANVHRIYPMMLMESCQVIVQNTVMWALTKVEGTGIFFGNNFNCQPVNTFCTQTPISMVIRYDPRVSSYGSPRIAVDHPKERPCQISIESAL
jgi:hypothetical protein